MKPLSRLVHSSKALVMIAAFAMAMVAVYRGNVAYADAFHFLTVLLPAWMISVGIEDAAKHTANGKVEAVRVTLRPPPPSTAADDPTIHSLHVPQPSPIPKEDEKQ